MRTSYAIALGSVGWYLLVPRTPEDNPKVARAPLSEWKIAAAFDSGNRGTWFLRALHCGGVWGGMGRDACS